RTSLERQPGGVREQVPHSRTLRAGWLVQVHQTPVHGHQGGEGSEQLGHRLPRPDGLYVAVQADDLDIAADGQGDREVEGVQSGVAAHQDSLPEITRSGASPPAVLPGSGSWWRR